MFFIDPAWVVEQNHTHTKQYVHQISSQSTKKCAGRSSPIVRVKVKEAKVQYDITKTSAELETLSGNAYSPYGPEVHTEVGGLTRGKTRAVSQSVIDYTQKGKTVCLWFTDIDVVIETDPLVYIAKKHMENNCRYKQIMTHEMKHVRVQRKIIKEYRQRMRQHLTRKAEEIGVVGPVPVRDSGQTSKEMRKKINDAAKEIIDEILAERGKRQRSVDTKEEYALISRELKRCNR